MKGKLRNFLSLFMAIILVISGVQYEGKAVNAAEGTNIINIASANAKNYVFLTSNANNDKEGFLTIDNGFSSLNCANENLTNGNNLLGKTATTDEVAIYVNLRSDYDISSALVYQGSTNAGYKDSYCKSYSIYYSTEEVNATNQGNITWNLAGSCTNGTIYSGAQIDTATDISSTGDAISFNGTYTARSVKVVFDKDSCMGTTKTGTVSVLSFQVFGAEHQTQQQTEQSGGETTTTTSGPSYSGTVKVLFIGNSFMYYNTCWNMFKDIAAVHGRSVKVTAATNGGQNLSYQATADNVLNAINADVYDIVILQDKVGSNFQKSVFLQGCSDIIPKIRAKSPNAQLAFYEPWPTKDQISSKMAYFTESYIEAANKYNALLAPAGEGFYDLYVNNGLDYYCSDNRHPQPLGTFNSASTIYYALFPNDPYYTYSESQHSTLNTVINNNVAYTSEGQLDSYNMDTLNKINAYAYKYAHAVIPAVKGTGTYTSVANGGRVADPVGSEQPTNQTGNDTTLYGSYTTDLAQGKQGYASSNDRNQSTPTPTTVGNLTDGNDTSFIVTHKSDTAPWFAVDLGSVQDINKVNVVPGGTGDYAASFPVNYEIQVATEVIGVSGASNVANLTWKTVATVTGGNLNAKAVTFPRQQARWIRVKVNSASAATCSLMELYVYQTNPATTIENNGNDDDDTMDVLFIGNSMTYYNNLAKVVKGIAGLKGHTINCTAATNGGQNLIYQSTAANVLAAVQNGNYDVVILQDIVGGFDADKLQQGAEAMVSVVKQYHPNAQIIFYEPWPTKDTISGQNSLLPYFTGNYIKTAKSLNAKLAPAGEAFYELYTDHGLDYYCTDNKHPQPLGTFTSASTIYYTLFGEEAYGSFSSGDQNALDSLINTNVAYTEEGKQNSYSLETLNLIFSLGYKYARAVDGAVKGTGTYTSVGGSFVDLDAEVNPNNLPAAQGTVVDSSVFAVNNLALNCNAYASSTSQAASNAVDGKTGTRWESAFSDPQWFYVDLGSKKAFDTVGFIWEGAYASKYYIQISDDGLNWTTIKHVTASSVQTVQIDLGQTYNARYIRMYGTKRGTQYGYSFYEMGVWNQAGGEQESTSGEVTTESPVQVNDDLQISGYQISATVQDQNGRPGGVRVISQIEPTINGKNVVKTGMIYSLTEYNGTSFSVMESDMTVDATNQYVAVYETGAGAALTKKLGDSQTANYFAITMTFGGSSKEVLTAKYKVRCYAQLADGSYVYSSIESYNIFSVAKVLYDSCKMQTETGHSFLYNQILRKVTPDYPYIDYNWGNVIVKKNEF